VGVKPTVKLRIAALAVVVVLASATAGGQRLPPDSRLAVTIPTVDPQRGLLTGIVVQLMTLVVDTAHGLRDVPHAEWSVRTVWG
jgi:hypothetical protein